MATGGPHDALYIAAGAAIQCADFHATLPHFFIGHAVGTDHTDMLKFVDEVTQLEDLSHVEIDDDDVGEVALDVMANFFNVARHYNIFKMRMQVGCEVFGDNTV